MKGQGRNIRSAGLERFLQLCAEDNHAGGELHDASNYFHICAAVEARLRKPLILMTPKFVAAPQACGFPARRDGSGYLFHRVFGDDAQLHPNGTR